jgi:hypothetical protein
MRYVLAACLLAITAPDARQAAPIVLPIEVANNHVFVPVTLGGVSRWFLLDTGAAISIVDIDAATAAGVQFGESVGARGAGSGMLTGAAIESRLEVEPGGNRALALTIQQALPLTNLARYEGRAVDGILGADFIGRHVVEIDYAGRRLRLHDAARFQYTGPGVSVPLTMRMGHPHITSAIEIEDDGQRIDADFVIDVGSRLGVILTQPFVADHFLDRRIRPTITGAAGRGVGGSASATLGRLRSLRLGGLDIARPIVAMFGPNAGVLSTREFFEGNLGGEILRRFTVFFDYEHRRVIFEKNADFGAPFEYDMSGLTVALGATDKRTIVVSAVLPQSPAADQGLTPGDEIVSVEGRPSDQIDLDTLRGMFRKAGVRYRLVVRRGASPPMAITLSTRRLI